MNQAGHRSVQMVRPNQRGLLRAAGEQEDFRPLFAHQKTGPSAGLGSPRTHLLGTCSPADRRICVSSLGRSRGRRSKARFPPARLLHAGGSTLDRCETLAFLFGQFPGLGKVHLFPRKQELVVWVDCHISQNQQNTRLSSRVVFWCCAVEK